MMCMARVIGAGALAFALCGLPAYGADEVIEREKLAELPARWKQAIEDLKVPGLAVAVIQADEVLLLETLGTRDIRSGAPVTRDTAFYLASCTKAFTATAIMQLVEAGRIDLDAPVKTYLPRFELADPEATARVTVEDLLSHRQGLGSNALSWLEAYTGEITEDRFYHFLKQVQPEGTFRYSNLNYTIAGRIIEAVTGKDWKMVLASRIFEPLGMASSTCSAEELYARDDVAIPTELRSGEVVVAQARKTDRTMHAAGGNAASIDDLVRWMRFQLGTTRNDGVLSVAGLRQMHRRHAAQRREVFVAGHVRTGYGFGWNLAEYRGLSILEHGGGFAGTSVAITLVPDRKVGIAVLCNASSPLPPFITADVLDVMAGHAPGDGFAKLKAQFDRDQSRERKAHRDADDRRRSDGRQQPDDLESYEAVYMNERWGRIHLTLEDGVMKGAMGVLPLEVDWLGDHRIRLSSNTGAEFTGRFEFKAGAPAALLVGIAPNEPDEVFVRQ